MATTIAPKPVLNDLSEILVALLWQTAALDAGILAAGMAIGVLIGRHRK